MAFNMIKLQSLLNSRYTLWALLMVPGIAMVTAFVRGTSTAEQLLHPSGEFSARFMIIAMAVTPLLLLFPKVLFSNG